MLSKQKAQTGKRVYGGTSQSPNRGQVSARGAQGYIKREVSKKKQAGVKRRVGGDGKSDNRSAVVAKALQRRKHPVMRPPTDIKRTSQTKTSRGADGKNVVTKTDTTHETPAPPAPAPPTQVVVNKNGILELPYDQTFAAGQLAAITDANDQLAALKLEGDQQAQEYGQGKRQANLAYDSLKHQSLNENAAQGTAFSSKYGTAVAANAGAYANQLGELENANTGFLQNQNLQRTAIQNSLNQQLAGLAQQRSDDLNAEAGTLGFGQAVQPPKESNLGRATAQRKAAAKKRKQARERAERRRKQQRANKKGGKK